MVGRDGGTDERTVETMGQTTDYIGIDYSLGRSNVDKANGIHFGVIGMNSINLDCAQEFEHDYGEPHCPKCGNRVKESTDATLFPALENDADTPDWFDEQDFACLDCEECYWSDQVYGDEAIGWTYVADRYKLTNCLDNDIFVLESPYYTYAQYCSPCVPGACNLDYPLELEDGTEGLPRVYALGHDWFDNKKAPYRVWTVADGIEVVAEVSA